MTRLYRRLQQPYGRFSVFFIITEHWQGVQTLPLDDIVVISAVLDPTQMNIQIINSRHSYIQVDYSHDFFKRGALARFDRSPLPDHNGTRTVVLRFFSHL